MKKFGFLKRLSLGAIAVLMVCSLALAGCSGGGSPAPPAETADAGGASPAPTAPAADTGSDFDASKGIGVVSREDGSGTRTAFIELMGIEEKGDDGSKTDRTTKEAVIVNQTEVMLTNISGNAYGIGYVSLGSLNDTVKAVKIEGVDATPENVKNGSYIVSRPFNIATKGAPSGIAQDFIDFILSADGQAVVTGNKYIAVVEGAPAYAGSGSGKLTVAGSSSVTPVMEKLKEAYVALNADAQIEIQMSDSSAGATAAIDGTAEIGMLSRALKDTELEQLTPVQIALDGIAVIINNGNPTANLTKDQVKSIFIGETTAWSAVA